MSDKFLDRYRNESSRLPGWDYSREGVYFITICTANKECLFGEIYNKNMKLSEIGEIVEMEWEKSFTIRTELNCAIYTIMPNHIHAILRIGHDSRRHARFNNCRDARPCVPTIIEPVPTGNNSRTGVAYRSPKSISSFVAGFKSSATKRINKYRTSPGEPVWQSRFYDHIIRNKDEYWRIRQYIKDNPANWDMDRFYKGEGGLH